LAKKIKNPLEIKLINDTSMSQIAKGLVKKEASGTMTIISKEIKAA